MALSGGLFCSEHHRKKGGNAEGRAWNILFFYVLKTTSHPRDVPPKVKKQTSQNPS